MLVARESTKIVLWCLGEKCTNEESLTTKVNRRHAESNLSRRQSSGRFRLTPFECICASVYAYVYNLRARVSLCASVCIIFSYSILEAANWQKRYLAGRNA